MKVRDFIWFVTAWGEDLCLLLNTRATKVRYLIDAKASTFRVRAFATGMLSAFGHNPTISIPDIEGEIRVAPDSPEDASLRIVIQAVSLAVADDISSKDRQEIERRMHGEVLETESYPEIIYECSRAASVQELSEEFLCSELEWRVDFARGDSGAAGFGARHGEG